MNICASRGTLLSYAPDDGFASSFPYSCLPIDALAAAFLARWAVDWLQVSSNLLDLFSRGGGTARGSARKLARAETAGTLPTVGWAGGRSCAGGEDIQCSTFGAKRSMNWQFVVCE